MFRKVENRRRKNAAAKFYYHIRDQDGVDYLFSEAQMAAAQSRALANPEDTDYEFEEAEGRFWMGALCGVFFGAMSCVIGYAISELILNNGVWIK
jgi:hypothetical protein